LPDYLQSKTDAMRGPHTFGRSIEAIRRLNAVGYGSAGTGLVLDLVHNPAGAYLPASQSVLEQEYRRRLMHDHSVVFNRLFTITNCPVGRYRDYLVKSDNYSEYMETLAGSFNTDAASKVMCRTTLSVGCDGTLYDCDFNQMLNLTVNHGAPNHIDRFDFAALSGREIVVDNHCFACTAGAGSSCQGSTA